MPYCAVLSCGSHQMLDMHIVVLNMILQLAAMPIIHDTDIDPRSLSSTTRITDLTKFKYHAYHADAAHTSCMHVCVCMCSRDLHVDRGRSIKNMTWFQNLANN